VRGILADSPRAEDLELIAASLITCAIRHSPAGEEGGQFTVTIRTEEGCARLEVHYAGTGTRDTPPAVGMDAWSRLGLAILDALASTFGHYGDAADQTMWAELTWTVG
jgi:hypothetical protein